MRCFARDGARETARRIPDKRERVKRRDALLMLKEIDSDGLFEVVLVKEQKILFVYVVYVPTPFLNALSKQ